MRVRVRVRDHTLTINVGQGSQRLKWLAVISLQRYEETIGEDSGEKTFSSAHVATGIMDAAGTLLPPNKSIRVALEDMQEVFVLVQADEDPKGAPPPPPPPLPPPPPPPPPAAVAVAPP